MKLTSGEVGQLKKARAGRLVLVGRVFWRLGVARFIPVAGVACGSPVSGCVYQRAAVMSCSGAFPNKRKPILSYAGYGLSGQFPAI